MSDERLRVKLVVRTEEITVGGEDGDGETGTPETKT